MFSILELMVWVPKTRHVDWAFGVGDCAVSSKVICAAQNSGIRHPLNHQQLDSKVAEAAA